MKYIFICLLFFFTKETIAQSNFYTPKNRDSIFQYFEKITSKRINSLDGKYKSKKKRIYKKHLEQIKVQIIDSTFIFIPEISHKLNDVLLEIYKANPSIKKNDFYFLINKSIYPNAAAYGDGSFVVNLGLFSFLNSDDEIAFILCHEIAHLLSNDVNKGISNYIDKINSKELKSKVNKINRKRYGKTRAGLSFIKELSFDIFKHSRTVEMNADNLGFKLFSKTAYNKNASITTLKKLGELENLLFSNKIDFDNLLSFNGFSFNNEWISKKRSMFNTSETVDDYKFTADSLRSHPHAKDRIKNILNNYKVDTLINVFKRASIKPLQLIAHKTLVETLFNDKHFDLLLYKTLKNIQDNNGIEIDYNYTARSLQAIYNYKKNHSLGKYIPQVSPFSDEKYLNEVKQFIHKIELGEIKKLTLNFCNKYSNQINKKISKEIINKLNNKQ